jgi:hypothetical protein
MGRLIVFAIVNIPALVIFALVGILPRVSILLLLTMSCSIALYLWFRACALPRLMYWTVGGRRLYPLILTQKPNGVNDLWKYSYLTLDEEDARARDSKNANIGIRLILKRIVNG